MEGLTSQLLLKFQAWGLAQSEHSQRICLEVRGVCRVTAEKGTEGKTKKPIVKLSPKLAGGMHETSTSIIKALCKALIDAGQR